MTAPTTHASENDKLVAEEAAFVAAFDAKDQKGAAPKVDAKGAPKVESKEAPVDPATASEPGTEGTAVATDPTVTDPVEGKRLGKEDPATADATPNPDEDEVPEVTDEAFQAAMAAERVAFSLDSIPEAARPLVQKKLKDFESGWHRQMRKLADDRREIADERAEKRFREEQPDDFIVTMLEADPTLMDRVNAKLDEFEKSPTARRAHGIIVDNARTKAKETERKALDAEKERTKKSDELTKTAKAAAKAYGVPFEMGVEAEIAAHLAIGTELSEADIKEIARAKAVIWKRQLREIERGKSQKYVEGKVEDRKKAGLAVKPSTGTAPAPSALPTPKNEDEFIAQFVQKGG